MRKIKELKSDFAIEFVRFEDVRNSKRLEAQLDVIWIGDIKLS